MHDYMEDIFGEDMEDVNEETEMEKKAREQQRKKDKKAFLKAYMQPHNEAMQYKQNFLTTLYAKYPYFFHKDICTFVNIPVGWLQGVEQAFDKFAAAGMGILITEIRHDCGNISVQVTEKGKKKNFQASMQMLNSLLESVSHDCVLCGTNCKSDAEERKTSAFSRQESKKFMLCQKCEKTFHASQRNQNKPQCTIQL